MKLSGLLAILAAGAAFAVVHAEVPATLTYQGKVQVAGTNFTGTGQFKFALVDAGSNAVRQATATAVVNSGFVTGINVTDGGSGYPTAPQVQITDSTGSGAAATVTIADGVVTAISIQNAGAGYSASPTVRIEPPPAQIVYRTLWSHDGLAVNGAEPGTFISVPVQDGIFTVILGDTNVANMTPLTAAVFANTGLHLRIWFNDGAQGFAQLTPDQPLTSVAFAMRAQVAEEVAAADIVRTIRSDNGTIVVSEKEGAVELSVAREGITSNELQRGAVTADKLASGVIPASLPPSGNAGGDLDGTYPNPVIDFGAVSGDKIAAQGVELSKLSRTGGTEGDVLKHTGTAVQWLEDGLTLPLAVNASGTSDQLHLIDNVDSAIHRGLLRLQVQHTNSQRSALMITSEAHGQPAITASTRGGGSVAVFTKTVNRTTSGGGTFIGPVLVASAGGESTVSAAQFSASNPENNRPAVDIEHEGTGVALQVDAVGENIATFRRKTINANGGSSTSTRIRFDRDGKGFSDGGTQTGGAGIAEAFEVEGDPARYEPGDVMVISTSRARQMARSAEPYSTLVAGVMATKPGVLLTEFTNAEDLSSHVPVGVIGVIPTKVSAENGPIRIGDLLVTSSTPGHAMKGDVATIRERPGCILGKALESFDASDKTGSIRVLVNVR